MSDRTLSVTNPSAAKIEQQRKILEELERQKKVDKKTLFHLFHYICLVNLCVCFSVKALGGAGVATAGGSKSTAATAASAAPQGGVSSSATSSAISSAVAGGSGAASTAAEQLQLNSNQRMAMEQANKSSFGYFVPQDSLFGNLILPVIPRIPPPN